MKRWAVPAIPFAVSLFLSSLTVGKHAYWQDSGLFLTAVHDVGVLYPPGFVAYELLCKLWTRILGFVDFTLAVHLFSAVCAAGAAATVAVAVRDFLLSKGPIFGTVKDAPPERAALCGVVAGVVVATGYTFWAAAIYAKGYALYYFVLSLLLWRMIRADESKSPRDFTLVAALIGLTWQAHPSATLGGLALLGFVAFHAKGLGTKGVAARVALAAACALGPAAIALPILTAREPWLTFGSPQSAGAFFNYLIGRRFVGGADVFGIASSRVVSVGEFLTQEYLVVGSLLAIVGLIAIFLAGNRRLLAGMAAWTVPYVVVTVLFKIEGQHDCWFVAAFLPLALAIGAGALDLAGRAGTRAVPLLAVAAAGSVVISLLINRPDLDQRHYELAEQFGQVHLDTVDPDAIVMLSGDDSNALAGYLQRVKELRRDVVIVTNSFLSSEWYNDVLRRRHPFLKDPDYAGMRTRFPAAESKDLSAAAFINANADIGRPIFCERLIPIPLLRPDLQVVPAGIYWKFVPPGQDASLNFRYWKFPIEPEQVRSQYRRKRGQLVKESEGKITVSPEAYERRLVLILAMARYQLALALTEKNDPAQAAKLMGSILALGDEELSANPDLQHLFGMSLVASGQVDRAILPLTFSMEQGTKPRNRATAAYYLGEIRRRKGDLAGAKQYFERAFSTPGLDDATRRLIEERLKTP